MSSIVTKIIDNGNDLNCVVLAILAEGYQLNEQDKFNVDVQKYVNYFFADSVYSTLKYKINVYSLFFASTDSGITHKKVCNDCPPVTVQPIEIKNTYFGCHFDSYNTHRLIDVASMKQVWAEMTNAFGTAGTKANHIPTIFCNSKYFGGLDNGDCGLISTADANAGETFLHETGGHILGGLGDEWGNFVESWNSTQLTPVRWSNVYSGTPVIKTYAGQQWKVPTATCKMSVLGQEFCVVCSDRIHTGIDLLIKSGGGVPSIAPIPPIQPPSGVDTSNSGGLSLATPPIHGKVLLQCAAIPNANIYVMNIYEQTGKTKVVPYQTVNAPNKLIDFKNLNAGTYLATVYGVLPNGTHTTESTFFKFTTP